MKHSLIKIANEFKNGIEFRYRALLDMAALNLMSIQRDDTNKEQFVNHQSYFIQALNELFFDLTNGRNIETSVRNFCGGSASHIDGLDMLHEWETQLFSVLNNAKEYLSQNSELPLALRNKRIAEMEAVGNELHQFLCDLRSIYRNQFKPIAISGNTLLVAISASEVYSTSQRMISRLNGIIPSYMKHLFTGKLEIIDNGNHVVILLSDYHRTKEVLAGLIADYLHEFCIVGQCCAFDDAFLIRLLEELKPRSIDKAILILLKKKVFRHIADAARNGRSPAHHRQSNVEITGIGLTEN